ncbi:MAG: hypothetical protein AAF684_11810 [Pseudomonadota bacterium]
MTIDAHRLGAEGRSMIDRRRCLYTLGLIAAAGSARAIAVEPAPAHIVAAHGSVTAARARHAALLAAAKVDLVAQGRSEAEADAILAEYRCPDCGARTQ